MCSWLILPQFSLVCLLQDISSLPYTQKKLQCLELLLHVGIKRNLDVMRQKLQGVQLRHFSHTCAVQIEDCEGWWLSSCRSSVAEQARYPGFDSRWLPAFSLSIFVSSHLNFSLKLQCMVTEECTLSTCNPVLQDL